MKNYVSVDELKPIEANFNFVIMGIEEHLNNDAPDPERIINSLMLISTELFKVIQAAEQE